MADRRALIIVPLYDGKWLPPLAGGPVLVNRLSKCLARHGAYRGRRAFARFGRLGARYFVEFIRDELNDPKALTLILTGLSDVNEDVRVEAIRLLEEIGAIPEVLGALQATLDDPDIEVRRRAGATLAKYGSAKTVRILTQAIQSPNARARQTAVESLGLMGKKARQALVEALGNDDEHVQAEAALILCEHGQKDGVPILLAKLQSASGRQAERIIEGLGNAGDARAVDALVELLPNALHRVRAVKALGKIGGTQAYHCLQHLLEDRSDEVRCAAIQAIDSVVGEEGVRRAVDVLARASVAHGDRFPGIVFALAQKRRISLPLEAQLKLLEDEDWEVRAKSAKHLGQIKAPGAVGPLIAVLGEEEGDDDVQREVAKALGLIGDARAVELLIAVLRADYSDYEVQCEVAKALGLIGDARAVEPLIAMLGGDDSEDDVRREAAKALGLIGDARALGMLQRISNQDPTEKVKSAANVALKRIKRGLAE